MPALSGGQAVIAALQREGVEAVFGIPGTYNLHIYDAVQATHAIRHILARHDVSAGDKSTQNRGLESPPNAI